MATAKAEPPRSTPPGLDRPVDVPRAQPAQMARIRVGMQAGNVTQLKPRVTGWRSAWPVLRDAVSRWMEKRCPSMGAAIAYYTAFSLAPLLVIVIAVAGLIFGYEAASGAVFQQFAGLIGADGAKALQAMIASASDVGDSTWAIVIGVGLLLFSATSVFGELQSSLNVIWDPPPSKRPAATAWVRARLASLGMVLSLGFLFMVLMIVGTAVDALSDWLNAIAPGLQIVAIALNTLLSLAVTFALFGLIFRMLPDFEIPWSEVWFGAAISTLLFHVGRWVIGAYIANAKIASTFGAASALVVVLVWVYYSAQIFLFGACITKVVSERRRPQAHAHKAAR